ncbi:energy-coupling factor transporter transmembrane component T family protein [Neomoorella mulderi]|uniref:Energy-coupling factor transporter transmembrane protein EcfT n=1 Tax=Moorella mulderi DSM 14980 TaxID=1122241 RepID=A0A151AT64_9FIRM|nr:energy-coupling factor transporter transmembrane component T [Moorella mulderi]KYH30795.1 energy-coupling factor transporter transmembrane protein EcfT [Moorella mulderi DSM 14980]
MKNITLYQPGNSIFHYCDSRTKLVLILCFAVLAFLYFNPLIPLALMLVVLVLNVVATKSYALTNALTKLFLIIILFFLVIHGFTNPLGKTPAVFWGHPLTIPFFGTYTLEGAYYGLTFGFRIATVALITLLYVSTTHPIEVVRGLVKLGLPYNFGFMILMSLQLIPISNREAKTIISAQRARGLVEHNLWEKLKSLVPLFVPLVVSSLERMETMAMALEARGFGYTEHPTQLHEVKFTARDIIIIASAIILLVIGLVLRFKYGRLSWIDHLNSWGNIFWPG